MDRDPKGDVGREVLRDVGFPSLQEDHPSFVVVRGLLQDRLEVALCFETELEEVRAEWSSCKSSNSGPVLEEEVNKSPSLLDTRVCYSANEGEAISFNKPRVICRGDDYGGSTSRSVVLRHPFSFVTAGEAMRH